MKRPAGFDSPPAARRPQPPRDEEQAVAPAAPVTVQDSGDPAPDVADTAPIPVQKPKRGAAGRSAVRSAARQRRRYERAEVRRFTVMSRRRRRTWLIAGGALVAMTAFVAGVAFSPIMALKVVQVEGANRVPATDIVEALSAELGTPLPLIDAGAVHDKLAGFTLIQSYSTESHPPDTLVVRIVERDPIGAITTPAGFDLVDSAGVVIASAPEPPAGFPLLDAPTPRALAAAGEVIRSLPADVRAQLTAVHAATRDDVTLELASGPRVVWGSADRSVEKAAVFSRLLAAAPGAGLYDVSSPSNPVYN